MRFREIFEGLDVGYGIYYDHVDNPNGKSSGKSKFVTKPPSAEVWENHLKGVQPSLGIVPIRADNTCTWGCIDIDQYPLDHKVLVSKIRKHELPLIVCSSKSGGAHCFLFTKEPIPAKVMQNYLISASALLGEAGREIFPKQAEILVERGDFGNFLNLPYFGGERAASRLAIKDDGEVATLDEFYEMYDKYAQDVPLNHIKQVEKEDDPIKNGPPCLQTLCSQGFPEGTRNNGLFNIGVYLKKAFPNEWRDKLMEYNQKYLIPPLGMNELSTIVRQLEKKEYKYKCKDAPINSFCNSGLCRTRRHGIGSDGPGSPEMRCLSKYNSEPPLWFLDVNSNRVELNTDELFNQNLFQKACLEKINILPPTLRKADWEMMINELLREMIESEQIVEASDDISITGTFIDLLEEFTTHYQQAHDREEILLGRPYLNSEEGFVYFRVKDLQTHLRRKTFTSLTPPKIAQRLKDLKGENLVINIKGRSCRVWKIPKFKEQDSPFDLPETIDKDPF